MCVLADLGSLPSALPLRQGEATQPNLHCVDSTSAKPQWFGLVVADDASTVNASSIRRWLTMPTRNILLGAKLNLHLFVPLPQCFGFPCIVNFYEMTLYFIVFLLLLTR